MFEVLGKDICQQLLDEYGQVNQLDQSQEELGELIVAINKYKRYQDQKHLKELISEIIDCMFMIEQLFFIFKSNKIDFEREYLVKLNKLKGYLKGYK